MMLHTYGAEQEKAQLPPLEVFSQMVVAAGSASYAHTTLANFESLYDTLPGKNYGCYQRKLHVGAKQIYDAAGLNALQQLWTVLQKTRTIWMMSNWGRY